MSTDDPFGHIWRTQTWNSELAQSCVWECEQGVEQLAELRLSEGSGVSKPVGEVGEIHCYVDQVPSSYFRRGQKKALEIGFQFVDGC